MATTGESAMTNVPSRPVSASRRVGAAVVYSKTLRDSRIAILGIGLVLGMLVVATAYAIADQFDTLAARQALAAEMRQLPPLFQGLIGPAINLETLPGFVSWRLVSFMPLMVGLWSVVALSGTLAAEASRGTLELVLSTPITRRSVAAQKYMGHVTGIVVAVLIISLVAWLGSLAFATLPGDLIEPASAVAEFALVGLIALFAGSIAFALASLVGRATAAGVAAIYLFASYVVNGFAGMVPGFDLLRTLSIFHWTQGHRPMAGVTDWPAFGAVLIGTVLLAVIGIVLFVRRDLGSTVALGARVKRGLHLPGMGPLSVGRWSLRGPFSRSFADRLPAALLFGGAMAVYGGFIAFAADQFAATIDAVPQMQQMIEIFYPEFDFSTVGGVLQLAIFAFLVLIMGLAAATLVAGWASEERDGQLEQVLATPLRRTSWVLRSGVSVLLACLLMGVVMGVGPALGAAVQGDPFVALLSGGIVLGAYGAALIGVGFVVAGLGRPQFAGLAVAGLALAFYLLDLIGSILRLPDEVMNLSLNRHLGKPMIGIYDVGGLIFCAAVAIGGLILASYLYSRRDLKLP
jgi:ABC-2 type transport system permease protein